MNLRAWPTTGGLAPRRRGEPPPIEWPGMSRETSQSCKPMPRPFGGSVEEARASSAKQGI